MKEEGGLLLLLIIIFVFAIIMLLNQQSVMTGYATTGDTFSNVSITTYFSIAMSENLSDGIQFGSISSLPATDINASHNHDGASSATTMWMNVSTDSNTAVDFCINASATLSTTGGDSFQVGNETYANSTWNNITDPRFANEVSLTAAWVKSGYNITAGSDNYYRFWLDIPAAQASGTYNNTVEFKGVSIGGGC
jgi:hypothetical protein